MLRGFDSQKNASDRLSKHLPVYYIYRIEKIYNPQIIMEKQLTIRQYAKLIGTTHPTVLTAIQNGYIDAGFDKETKKIIRDIADAEWGLEFRNRKLSKESTITQDKLNSLSNITVAEIQLSPSDDYKTAERKKIIIQAQRELIKLKQESGELVNKEEMYREMFEFGKEIRSNIMAIPDRVIDLVMAATDRHEAHKLLTEELTKCLEKLSSNEEGN